MTLIIARPCTVVLTQSRLGGAARGPAGSVRAAGRSPAARLSDGRSHRARFYFDATIGARGNRTSGLQVVNSTLASSTAAPAADEPDEPSTALVPEKKRSFG